MADPLESVKHIAAAFSKWSEAAEERGKPATRFREYESQLLEVADDLARLMKLTTALPNDMRDLFDLPAELRAELSVAKTDELEDQLVTVINAHGGEATLDQILVGLYRKFGLSQKRRFIQNKLYRMTKSEMVWAVSGRKGVYSTTEQETEAEGARSKQGVGWDEIEIQQSERDEGDDIPF